MVLCMACMLFSEAITCVGQLSPLKLHLQVSPTNNYDICSASEHWQLSSTMLLSSGVSRSGVTLERLQPPHARLLSAQLSKEARASYQQLSADMDAPDLDSTSTRRLLDAMPLSNAKLIPAPAPTQQAAAPVSSPDANGSIQMVSLGAWRCATSLRS